MRNRSLGFIVPAIWLILFSCAALGQPPKEENKREADLIELIKLDKSIKLDIRYATANNFVGRVVYPEARAFLQRPAAEAVVRVHQLLRKEGLGLVIFDGYRPWTITKLFWDVTPEDKRMFVADPAKGSKHNRGCAADLSMFDRKTGKLVPMPTAYDEFSERASPDYTGGTDEERANRDKLRRLMEAEGFVVNANEWWHFDYKDWQEYAIYDVAFSAIRSLEELKGLNVRHVEILGNDHVNGRTIFRKIALNEGDIFTEEALLKSVRGINSLGLFEKITDQNISWRIDRKRGYIDFTFFLTEKGKN